MKDKQWYEIRNASTKSADIYIYEQIGADWWSGEGVTAKAFVKDLKALGSADINLHINSGGGSVFDASAIYTALKAHSGKVTSYIDGIAASAASFVALAADHVVMADNALFMIHNPFGGATGDAKAMRDMADLLDKVRDTMLAIYMSKTNLSEAELLSALDCETWYSASEAQSAGFIDEITNAALAAANFSLEPLRALGYRNIPAQLTEREMKMPDEAVDPVDEAVDPATSAPVVEPAPAVEAVRRSPAFTNMRLRSPINSGGTYLEHTMKAALGNRDSADYIRAADDSFSTNTGFDRPNFITPVIDVSTKFGRPTIEAFGGTQAYAFDGLTVTVPKVTTNQAVGVVAENGATTETNLISGVVTGTVEKFAGMGTFSQEMIDLQRSPIFYDTMLKNLAAAYAKKTNEAVIAKVVADGTAATVQAATVAGLIAFHSVESVAAYLATGDPATSFVMGGSIASLLIGATDSTGRPIFNSIGNTANAGGSVTARVGVTRGDFLGLDAFLDRGMVATSIDDSCFIIVPSSLLLLEQAPQKLMVAQLGLGQYEVSLHGYLAQVTQVAAGMRRFNI